MEEWTQEEAIAFECAREVITDMMAIHSGQIAEEEAKSRPDPNRLAQLRAERTRLARERTELHVHDYADIARIRAVYGGAVRAHRAG